MIDALQDTVRLSWEVMEHPTRKLDLHIQQMLINRDGFWGGFEKRPDPALLAITVRSSALPTVFALFRSSQLFKSWGGERAQLRKAVDLFGLEPHHKMVFLYTVNLHVIDSLISYGAATFAFTTRYIPEVVSFNKLARLAFSFHPEDAEAFNALKQRWLLFVTHPIDADRLVKKTAGTLLDFFRDRVSGQRATVFVDAMDPRWIGWPDPTLHVIKTKVAESSLGKTALLEYMFAPTTYFQFVAPERKAVE